MAYLHHILKEDRKRNEKLTLAARDLPHHSAQHRTCEPEKNVYRWMPKSACFLWSLINIPKRPIPQPFPDSANQLFISAYKYHFAPPFSSFPPKYISLLPMDRFLAPHTSEAIAHSHLTYVPLATPPSPSHSLHSENWFSWDQDHPSFNETLVAGCASYQAFNRYLSGLDLFIIPRSRSELESVLSVYFCFVALNLC